MDNAEELYNVGYAYYHGTNGVEQNYQKAYEYFLKAAQLKMPKAMNYLGVMCFNGYGVKKNINDALGWYSRAGAEGDVNAQYNLAEICLNGTEVKQDIETALKLYTAVYYSKTELSRISATNVGFIYMNYYKDYYQAFKWFLFATDYAKSKDKACNTAYHNLGVLCESGQCPEPELNNISGAISFYEEAANLGYLQSMDDLGRLYAGAKQYKESTYWLEKAVSMGYTPSKSRLKAIKFMKWF